MTAPVFVLAVGVGTPSLRVAAADVAAAWGDGAARGAVGACAPDEDVLTLSWAAADAALSAAAPVLGSSAAEALDGLWWGTSRPPYADGPSHATLAASIGLPGTAGGALLAGSPHSGVEALLAAWDAVAAGTARLALVVAADAALPGLGTAYERRAGAGAVAWLLSAESGSAALAGRATRSRPVLDRYRGDREDATRDVYDGRLFREQVFLPSVLEVSAALSAEGAAWSLPDPDGRMGNAVAKKLGTKAASAETFTALGDTGAAAPLLGATAALAAAGTVALVGYGGGRTTGVTVTVSAPVPGAGDTAAALARGRAATYAEVLRSRGQLTPSGETVAMGVPPGSAGFVRGAGEMLGLTGARCVDCGTVNTPPTIHPHCFACGGDKLTEVALAREGVVHTYVVNHAMPAPFVAPLPLAVIDLTDGSRVMLQVTGDAPELAIGDSVRLVLRRYAVERGAPVYGFKAERVSA